LFFGDFESFKEDAEESEKNCPGNFVKTEKKNSKSFRFFSAILKCSKVEF